MTQENPSIERRRGKWGRRLMWAGGILVVLLALAYFFGSALAGPMIRRKLDAMVGEYLNARLNIGKIKYNFPYGVEVTEVSLVAKDTDGKPVDLIKTGSLEIALAKLPLGSGPLVIGKVILKDPALRLIRTAEGFIGQKDLLKPESANQKKLSEIFELRLLSVEGGSIIYEDRTKAGTAPMAWRNINVALKTDPLANPIYGFDFTAGAGRAAELKAVGKFNIDEFDTDLSKLAMQITVDPQQKESPAPAQFQTLLKDYAVAGKLTIDASGRFIFKDYTKSTFDTTVRLAGARATFVDQTVEELGLTVRCSTSPLGAPATKPAEGKNVYVAVENFLGRSGASSVRLDQAHAVANLDQKIWNLSPAIIQLVLSEKSPSDLAQGNVKLTLHGQGKLAPRADGKTDYDLMLRAESPKLILTQKHIEMQRVQCDVQATADQIVLLHDGKAYRGFTATLAGGTVVADGKLQNSKSGDFEGKVRLANLDLAKLQSLAASNGGGVPLSGVASGSAQLSGAIVPKKGSALDALAGNGEVEVQSGDFYKLPVLSDILKLVPGSKDAATLGHAAAVFRIGGQTIHISKAAVSAPILGVQGGGTVGFDGKLDLKVVAVPLNDWQKKMRGSKIPGLTEAGKVLGDVQKVLNDSTMKMLYNFHVTGTTAAPKVTPEIVPALTENAGKLFGDMLKGQGNLLDSLKK